ncbi:MAG: zinc-ribbon domain-containing protein [Deltaproteobacteria bacterium]|nr:zinc-ribbon domain-containing protein [Deltaproteobacteria bacterium]
MKIQCQSCQAKYTIADEKVVGKVVKIRCKKCSATIVINGNETRPQEDNADTNVFDYAAGANEQWTVNVADGDQRTMTPAEIASEYRTGVVNDETYCWKDGMADWLPLREIEQLYGAVKGLGRPPAESQHDDISLPPQSVPPPAGGGALFGGGAAPVESPFAGNNGANGHHADVAAPAAARRAAGRGQGADLFGNAATAGGEEDVMTSAATSGGASAGGGGGGGLDEQKLTGQRNESSVLFSLSALTEGAKKEAGPANRTTAAADGSGLIDIRALSQTMGSDEKKDTNARVDDIMNLSGGGAFGAALAAPILAPPPLEVAAAPGAGADSGGGNKMLLVAIIAGAALIAVGIVVAVVLTRPSVQPVAENPNGLGSNAAAMGAPNAAGTGSAMAANDPSGAGATGNPSTAVTAPAATDNTPPPPGTGQAAAAKGTPATAAAGAAKPATGAGNPGAIAAATPAAPAKPEAPKAPEPPKDFGSALAAAAGKPATEAAPANAGGGTTAPFDRGAAAASLGAINVQSCKKPDGPTGTGHVKVTFAPNGSVSSAVVDGGPFPGTPVGGCIAGKFRSAHVPPFSGAPVGVGKSFTIN